MIKGNSLLTREKPPTCKYILELDLCAVYITTLEIIGLHYNTQLF